MIVIVINVFNVLLIKTIVIVINVFNVLLIKTIVTVFHVNVNKLTIKYLNVNAMLYLTLIMINVKYV